MIPRLSLSSNPSRTARRNQVRRLFVRNRLSMGQIARRLHVSKPTVMRDLRWWRQQPVEESSPEIGVADLLREIEDMKEEAWCAYARIVELKEQELDATRSASAEEGSPAPHGDSSSGSSKRVRGKANSEWRYLNLIAKLIDTQARLLGPVAPAGQAEEEDERPNVVLYLPDNGRDRKEREIEKANRGMNGAETAEARQVATAEFGRGLSAATNGRARASIGGRDAEVPPTFQKDGSTRSCGRNTADEKETFLSSGCNAVPANSSSNNLASPVIPRLTSGATVSDSTTADIELKRNVTICNGVKTAQPLVAQAKKGVLDETQILSPVTLTTNNSSRLKPELQQDAGASGSSSLSLCCGRSGHW